MKGGPSWVCRYGRWQLDDLWSQFGPEQGHWNATTAEREVGLKLEVWSHSTPRSEQRFEREWWRRGVWLEGGGSRGCGVDRSGDWVLGTWSYPTWLVTNTDLSQRLHLRHKPPGSMTIDHE